MSYSSSLFALLILAGCSQDGLDGPPGSDGSDGSDGMDGMDGMDAATCIVAAGEPIQDCVDLVVAAGGGRVLLEAGDWELSSHVHIHGSDVTLQGAGAATRLRLADEALNSVLFIGTTAASPTEAERISNIEILDLAIDGNKHNQSSEFYGDGSGHTVNGVTVRNAWNVVLQNLIIEDSRSGGVVTTDDVRFFVADGLMVSGAFFDSLAMYVTEDSLVIGCRLEGSSAAAISTDLGFNHNIISDTLMVDNGWGEDGTSHNPGLYMADSSDNLIESSIIRGSAGNGIILTDSGSGGAADNVFTSLRVEDNAEYALWADAAGTVGNVGHGNCFQGNAGTVLETNGAEHREVDPLCDLVP